MNSYAVASVVFVIVLTAALVGIAMNGRLPEHHRSSASHDAIKLGTGMISVLASLVLGLLTASIKTTFDTTDQQIRTYAADLILLDRTLRDYGPEATSVRGMLRAYTAQSLRDHWPDAGQPLGRMEDVGAGELMNAMRLAVIDLPDDTSRHRAMRASAVQLVDTLLRTRWLLIERSETSIQPAFLIVLIAWIVLIFLSFGYNAPANATVISAFIICAGAIAGCLFIIIEMDAPFDGLIAISSHAMRDALAHISQ